MVRENDGGKKKLPSCLGKRERRNLLRHTSSTTRRCRLPLLTRAEATGGGGKIQNGEPKTMLKGGEELKNN